jgi:hypothetical protein
MEKFRQCNEKSLGATYLCNVNYKDKLPMPQIWGTQVLAQVKHIFISVI